MSASNKLKIYFVVGEESGDILGSNLIDTFANFSIQVDPVGLGGQRMQARGVKSLFDIADLSVMGISGVLGRFPLLLRRIKQTADDVIKEKPDVLLLIDSPDFSYRVRATSVFSPISESESMSSVNTMSELAQLTRL